jgi:hypothetical protein
MEALFFLMNAIAVVILVVTSLKNDKRKPDEPMVGPYRFIETLAPPKPKRPPAPYLDGRGHSDA